MAELLNIETSKSRKSGKPDMTPLVDLGFLLITFFIYTTSFNKPATLDFATPNLDTQQTSSVNFRNTLTLILGEKNKIYWYQKELKELKADDLKETNYSSNGIRKLLNEKRASAPNKENWTVIIKPTEHATWANAVDILDETIITGSERKAVTELTARENELYRLISSNL